MWWWRVNSIIGVVLVGWHTLGCVWFLICDTSDAAKNPLRSVLEEESIASLHEQDTFTLYTITMHSVLLIFSGETVETMTNGQRLFSSLMNISGILLTSILIGEVAVLLAKARAATTEYELKMEEVMRYEMTPHPVEFDMYYSV